MAKALVPLEAQMIDEPTMLRVADRVARRLGRTEQQREELRSVALLGICEGEQKWDARGREALFYWRWARNAVVDHLRREDCMPRGVSIHYAVTELIDEWKREPEQERCALVAEVRNKARAALSPPQLEVVMRRAASETHRSVSRALEMGLATVCAHERAGIERLAAAVADDD